MGQSFIKNTMEVWKDVKGYEGLYQVSNLGQAKSLHKANHKTLSNCVNSRGYYLVKLCRDKTSKTVTVHSLVAQAFIGERPKEYDINHIDGNKLNNIASNLEYCTASQNFCHAIDTGLLKHAKGSVNGNSKLNETQVKDIKLQLANGLAQRTIARHFNVTHITIGRISRGETWSHI